MDKIRQQKLQYFLLDLDGKIKEINTYLMLDKGGVLLDAIEKFEEENAEFLQYNSSHQDELNKRKWIIQFILFPIIGDDKVEELLQYHLLEALNAGLDLEELMKRRAITISELLWPKISQHYLKALMQNIQLIGGDSLSAAGGGNSLLPYIKNWISLYNRRFGIDKHTGLEPHQFVLEDPNTKRLSKDLKEKLLKILNFYESLKVPSLSEIEAELRKMRMGFSAQQAAAYSVSRNQAPSQKYSGAGNKPSGKIAEIQKEILKDKRIKIVDQDYRNASENSLSSQNAGVKKTAAFHKEEARNFAFPPKTNEKAAVLLNKKEIIESHVLELLEKYPALQESKITDNPITLSIAPFTLSPTLQNWVQYYFKECGRGKHSLQERESFMEILKKSQNLGMGDFQKLQKVFRSIDEKTFLPFDKKNGELLLDLVKVGSKLKTGSAPTETPIPTLHQKSQPHTTAIFSSGVQAKPVMRISGTGINKPDNIESDEDGGYLDLELVPTGKKEE